RTLSMGIYGAAYAPGITFRSFGFSELNMTSSHQMDIFGERKDGSIPFEVSFSFKPGFISRALTFYVLDLNAQSNYVAVTLDPGIVNPLARSWQSGSGTMLMKEAHLDPITGEVHFRIRAQFANAPKNLRLNFRSQEIVTASTSRSYRDSFAGTGTTISITNFAFSHFIDMSNAIIGDMLGTWRNVYPLGMQITEQPPVVYAPSVTNPQSSVTGGNRTTNGSTTDLSFFETMTNSSHQANLYFDRLSSTSAFKLSFLATLDTRRVLTFSVLKSDDQSGHQVNFTYNPMTQVFSSKNAVGSGRIISAEAIRDPLSQKIQFNIVGEIASLPSRKLRLNFRSQKPGIDSFVGDPTVYVGLQNLSYQELLPDTTATPTMTVLKETTVQDNHAMQAYFYGYAKRTWTLDVEFRPVGARHISMFLANAANQSSNIQVRCKTSGAQILAPSNPALKNLTATVTAQADGWYRCLIRGVPDSTGGNQLRLIWYLNNNATNSSTYTGDGASGVMMRKILVTDK
ncbi:MAG: hypothetical protein AB7O96_12420, partial [Pseudobdellovibrionaceae bacterium]